MATLKPHLKIKEKATDMNATGMNKDVPDTTSEADSLNRFLVELKDVPGGFQFKGYMSGFGKISCTIGNDMEIVTVVATKEELFFVAQKTGQPPIKYTLVKRTRGDFDAWIRKVSRVLMKKGVPMLHVGRAPDAVFFEAEVTEFIPLKRNLKALVLEARPAA